MTTVNALYRLERILDNPKYEGFGMNELPSLMGQRNRYEDLDMKYDREASDWIVPRLGAIWKPLRVLGRVRPFNDFPCLGLAYPVFSLRAIDILREDLESNGELLPLQTSVGTYFLYNCTTIANIVDFEQSKIEYLNAHTITGIDHLQVFQERLSDLSIFQIRNYPGRCFVTDDFARRIRAAKLEGFEFRKI